MIGVNTMKTEFQRVKEEVAAAVQRVHDADALQAQQEDDCRRRYEEAQNAMSAALAAGDREGYRTAGMTAEAARLDLEFFEKSKVDQLPEASEEDDHRIRAALMAEAEHIRIDQLTQLKDLLTKAAAICEDTKKQLDGIDAVSNRWGMIVMKNPNPRKCYSNDIRMALGQFANAINGQLQRFTYMKGV
jgi:hypothetical protein